MNQIVNEIQVQSSEHIIENIKTMINSSLNEIKKKTEDKKAAKEMIDDNLKGNPVYRENAEKAKEADKVRKVTKEQVMSTPSMIALSQKVKDISQDIKGSKAALSDYLLEYERLTGANQLTLFDETTVDIIKSAKVIKHG